MNKEELRIVFMGTPEFAVEPLKTLVEGGYNVVAVVTQPDKPVGRHGSTLQPPAVKQYALSRGLPVLQPQKMKDPDFVEQLSTFQAHLFVVVAFRMLPEVVWAMPPMGTFNVHAALLPQYRGAAPINWAVINGESQTGVTTFFLDHDIDTGRIIMQRSFAIPPDANVEYVYNGLMHLGAAICVDTVDLILAADGKVETMPQEQLITAGQPLRQAPKIFKDTCRVNWSQPAKRVHDFVRGLSPYPGAWTTVTDSLGRQHTLKIFNTQILQHEADQPIGSRPQELVPSGGRQEGRPVNCGGRLYFPTSDGYLEVTELQLSGKRRMSARDFLNGFKL